MAATFPRRRRLARAAAFFVMVSAGAAGAAAAQAPPGTGVLPGQRAGRADPAFSQPSIAPGLDYTVPAEAEIKAALDRIRDHFVRSTPYRIIDTATSQPVTDFSAPLRTAGVDNRNGEPREASACGTSCSTGPTAISRRR